MTGCRPLSDSERKTLYSALSLREKLLVETGLYFGLRISESLSLRFKDLEGDLFYVHSGKNSRNDHFPVPQIIKDHAAKLKEYYSLAGLSVGSDSPVFLSRRHSGKPITRQMVSLILLALCEKLGISGKIGMHSFRKMFVMKVYDTTGKDIIKTKKYSRHKQLDSLSYYLSTTEDTDLVKEMVWD